jgi:hypothetical protein
MSLATGSMFLENKFKFRQQLTFIAENGHSYGTLNGVAIGSELSESQKVWTVLQAFGDIAFAYSFSLILIEIQVHRHANSLNNLSYLLCR